MTVGFSTFTDLVYADDTALLLPSATDATTSLKSFSDSASHLGQRQNYRTLVQALNHQGPNLQNILRQITIMPKLRSTYDGRLIYKTSYEGSNAFLRYDSLAEL